MGRSRIDLPPIYTRSAEETVSFGTQLGKSVKEGAIICLCGDLGAGKTTLVKGIVTALTEIGPEEVCSPTFAYLNIYEGKCKVYHFDLYRLSGVEDFLSLGFEEYLFSNGVCCLEWGERIAPILPENALYINLKHKDRGKREITYAVSKCQIC
jgi:tRNA threonylcarbamoyladenosine biosynthesis protein TsaE